MPNSLTYASAIPAFEKATTIPAGSGSCFARNDAQSSKASFGGYFTPLADTRRQVCIGDLSELAAKLTTQEVMVALANIINPEGDNINRTLRDIHRALLAEFGKPMKTPELMAKHKDLTALSKDLDAETYETHKRLFKALEPIFYASRQRWNRD